MLKTILCGLFLALSLPASSFSAQAGTADIVRGPFDVQTLTGDPRIQGAAYGWGHYWVSGAGYDIYNPEFMIHKFDMDGNYVASYPQEVGTTGLGNYDLEIDEATNTMWGAYDGGNVSIYSYSPGSGGLYGGQTRTTPAVHGFAGFTRDPNSGLFYFYSYFINEITVLSPDLNYVVDYLPTSSEIYGLSWSENTNTLWAVQGEGYVRAIELDPFSGVETGRRFDIELPNTFRAGGCDIYDDPNNPGSPTLALIAQGCADQLACYDVDSITGTSPDTWPHLPANQQLIAAVYQEGFEDLRATTPSYLQRNSLNPFTNRDEPGALVNSGPSTIASLPAFSGSYCLELGRVLNACEATPVRSGFIVGLDGTNQGDLTLDFKVRSRNKVADTWDGIFVSDDGINWNQVYGPWQTGTGGGTWTTVTGVDLSQAGLASGWFYLLFAYEGELGFDLEGVQIDEIKVNGTWTKPILNIQNTQVGEKPVVELNQAIPYQWVDAAYSTAGFGPFFINGNWLPISPPWTFLNPTIADGNGYAKFDTPKLPTSAMGLEVWMLAASGPFLSNSVNFVIN
ncbi:MAG: hypothetical protein H8E15_11625 [Planctomycetes bacterium]|nr:hypothetical protein [Planctomycetota bacterium]